jgi:ribonucleoside-triphosphate reductase (thioredoxin)
MNESLRLLSDLTFYMKYSKYDPAKKRRETWEETIERNKSMHLAKFPQCKAEIDKAYELVMDKKILPSMRSMQFGGDAIKKNNARMYNCSAIGLDSLDAFKDLFYLLLCGTGVGFSVRRNFIKKLPNLLPRTGKTTIFQPEDSIEGWADCVDALTKAYFNDGNRIEYDFSLIRPKGALIHSSMCAAPGPEPLRDALENIKKLLDKKLDNNDLVLSSLDCYDICCHISEAVLSGGVRRSAMICLFDKDDDLMLHAKEGKWWEENPQRGVSNNSVQFDRATTTKEEFDAIFKQTEASGCGEPGVVWTNNADWLVNPCCEISMPSHGFCNLTSINFGTVESQEDFNERAYYCSVLGTLQAAYTDFKYVSHEWKKNAEDMALIGVSLTGIAAHTDLTQFDFSAAVDAVKKANKHIAGKIGIKTADRLTTIKPDGTGSLVLGTSSGIHPWHAKHYIRRLRVNKLEPLYNYMSKNFPDLIEDEQSNPTKNAVLSLVIKAPDSAITRRNQTAIEFLERVKYMFEHWVMPGHVEGDNYNNVSCTCNVKNHEWDEVREWMWANRENYTGISLLPYSDSSYIQAPFEDTNEEVYKEFSEKHREFHLDEIEEEKNFVNFGQEAACAGGACEVI